MANLLANGGFEADWGQGGTHNCHIITDPSGNYTIEERGNIFTPVSWVTWFCDFDDFAQPEVRDAWNVNPDRMHSGQKGQLFFTFYKTHKGGFYQQANVSVGDELQLTAYAHAWSNHQDDAHPEWYPHPDDPRWSETSEDNLEIDPDWGYRVGRRAEDYQHTFRVGIDPTGGVNPLADSVVWGSPEHIYNGYVDPPLEVEAVAQSETVTVFLYADTQWPFKHNDSYWDDISLEVLGEEPPEPPEPPPVTDWPYPIVAEKGTKFGIHGMYSDGLIDEVRRAAGAGASLPVVKALDDLWWLTEVKRFSPTTVTIGRFVHGAEGAPAVNDPDTDLLAYAQELVNVILTRANEDNLAAVDYWEVVNEPLGTGPDPEVHARLAVLMMHCMDVAEENGLKLALFSYATGCPRLEDIDAIIATGVFARAREGGHILALHEGPAEEGEPIDQQYDYGTGKGYLHFRYRHWYELLIQRGEVVPFVNTEWYGDRYVDQGYDPSDVVEAFAWWDAEASKDYWVWGGLPFTFSPTPYWDEMGVDYDHSLGLFVDMAIALKDEPNALPPDEEPEPPEPPPHPQLPLYHAYILFPDRYYEQEWLEACAKFWAWYGCTIGLYVYDAVSHCVIFAVNPALNLDAVLEEHGFTGTVYKLEDIQTPAELKLRLNACGGGV